MIDPRTKTEALGVVESLKYTCKYTRKMFLKTKILRFVRLCASILSRDGIYYMYCIREKNVSVTAKRIFFYVNSIHNQFVNPKLIITTSDMGISLCNILLKKKTLSNSWYFCMNYQNTKSK